MIDFCRKFTAVLAEQKDMTVPLGRQLELMAEAEKAKYLLDWPWYEQYIDSENREARKDLRESWQKALAEVRQSGAHLMTVPDAIRLIRDNRMRPPNATLADSDLRVETARELCALLNRLCGQSALSKPAIARQAGISPSTLYSLIDLKRSALPQNKNDQLRRLLRAVGLPERQIELVMANYQELRERKQVSDASAREVGPAGRCGCAQPTTPRTQPSDQMIGLITAVLDDRASRLRTLLLLCVVILGIISSGFMVLTATLAAATPSTLVRAGSALATAIFVLPPLVGGYTVTSGRLRRRSTTGDHTEGRHRAERSAPALQQH